MSGRSRPSHGTGDASRRKPRAAAASPSVAYRLRSTPCHEFPVAQSRRGRARRLPPDGSRPMPLMWMTRSEPSGMGSGVVERCAARSRFGPGQIADGRSAGVSAGSKTVRRDDGPVRWLCLRPVLHDSDGAPASPSRRLRARHARRSDISRRAASAMPRTASAARSAGSKGPKIADRMAGEPDSPSPPEWRERLLTRPASTPRPCPVRRLRRDVRNTRRRPIPDHPRPPVDDARVLPVGGKKGGDPAGLSS